MYIGQIGYAERILTGGQKISESMSFSLEMGSDTGINEYYVKFVPAQGDGFITSFEKFRYRNIDIPSEPSWKLLDVGKTLSELCRLSEFPDADKTIRFIKGLLQRMIVFQFHDTSPSSKMKTAWNIADNFLLRSDGGNIAPVLFSLYENEKTTYNLIIQPLRMVITEFHDFVFEPSYNSIMLKWREKSLDSYTFTANQASDGTLRTIALTTLLLLPDNRLPNVVIIDEPELGLHPFAINVIGALIKKLSSRKQVIIATQSSQMLNLLLSRKILLLLREEVILRSIRD
jgi:predicted ATPase